MPGNAGDSDMKDSGIGREIEVNNVVDPKIEGDSTADLVDRRNSANDESVLKVGSIPSKSPQDLEKKVPLDKIPLVAATSDGETVVTTAPALEFQTESLNAAPVIKVNGESGDNTNALKPHLNIAESITVSVGQISGVSSAQPIPAIVASISPELKNREVSDAANRAKKEPPGKYDVKPNNQPHYLNILIETAHIDNSSDNEEINSEKIKSSSEKLNENDNVISDPKFAISPILSDQNPARLSSWNFSNQHIEKDLISGQQDILKLRTRSNSSSSQSRATQHEKSGSHGSGQLEESDSLDEPIINSSKSRTGSSSRSNDQVKNELTVYPVREKKKTTFRSSRAPEIDAAFFGNSDKIGHGVGKRHSDPGFDISTFVPERQIAALTEIITRHEQEIKRLREENVAWKTKYFDLKAQTTAKRSRMSEIEKLAENINKSEEPLQKRKTRSGKLSEPLRLGVTTTKKDKLSSAEDSRIEVARIRKRKDESEHPVRKIEKIPNIKHKPISGLVESSDSSSEEGLPSWTPFTEILKEKFKITKLPPEYYQFFNQFKSYRRISTPTSTKGTVLKCHLPNSEIASFLKEFSARFKDLHFLQDINPDIKRPIVSKSLERKKIISNKDRDVEMVSTDTDEPSATSKDRVDGTDNSDAESDLSSDEISDIAVTKPNRQDTISPDGSSKESMKIGDKIATRSQRNAGTGNKYQIWKDVVKANVPDFKFSADMELSMHSKISDYLTDYCEKNGLDSRLLFPGGNLKDQFLIPSNAVPSFVRWFKEQAKDDFYNDKRRKRKESTTSSEADEHYPLPMSLPSNPNYTLRPVRMFKIF